MEYLNVKELEGVLAKALDEELKKYHSESKGTSLKGFLDVVFDTCKFIKEQKVNEKPLTSQQIGMLIDIVEVLMKD